MVTTTEATIRQVVEQVLAEISNQPASATRNGSSIGSTASSSGDWGVHATVDDAVIAAQNGFEQLQQASLEDRGKALQCVRDICENQAEELGTLEFQETKIGRLDHKIQKLKIRMFQVS